MFKTVSSRSGIAVNKIFIKLLIDEHKNAFHLFALAPSWPHVLAPNKPPGETFTA